MYVNWIEIWTAARVFILSGFEVRGEGEESRFAVAQVSRVVEVEGKEGGERSRGELGRSLECQSARRVRACKLCCYALLCSTLLIC